tara:strand:- start:1448 stop:1867 length:420 start_codon:yes stop_codon:yes gene_type:complete
MKQIIFTLILIILTPKVYSQEKVIFNNFSKYEKVQVLQQIEILENVFKDSNTDTLEVYLSSDFTSMGQSMPMAIEVLKQMSAQMPKGSIKVLSASKTKNNLYDLDLELGYHGIYFKSTLDSLFKFIKLDYIEEKEAMKK